MDAEQPGSGLAYPYCSIWAPQMTDRQSGPIINQRTPGNRSRRTRRHPIRDPTRSRLMRRSPPRQIKLLGQHLVQHATHPGSPLDLLDQLHQLLNVLGQSPTPQPVADRCRRNTQRPGQRTIRRLPTKTLGPNRRQTTQPLTELQILGSHPRPLPTVQLAHWTPTLDTSPDQRRKTTSTQMVAGHGRWSPKVTGMNLLNLIGLLLGLSAALNIALTAGITARFSGLSIPKCILIAGSAASTTLLIYFAALATYQ